MADPDVVHTTWTDFRIRPNQPVRVLLYQTCLKRFLAMKTPNQPQGGGGTGGRFKAPANATAKSPFEIAASGQIRWEPAP